jgi:ATP-dependent DNA ligase
LTAHAGGCCGITVLLKCTGCRHATPDVIAGQDRTQRFDKTVCSLVYTARSCAHQTASPHAGEFGYRTPNRAGWSYEVKLDGYRTLAQKDGERVKLLSRNLKDATKLYPAVAREVGKLGAESVLLDGEVVAVDEDGRPSFQALHHQQAHTVVYYAFDLLHLNGRT